MSIQKFIDDLNAEIEGDCDTDKMVAAYTSIVEQATVADIDLLKSVGKNPETDSYIKEAVGEALTHVMNVDSLIDVIEILQGVFDSGADADGLQTMVHEFVEKNQEACKQELLKLLSKQEKYCGIILNLLGFIKDDLIKEALLPFVGNDNSKLRADAISSLGKYFDDPRVTSYQEQLLLNDPDEQVRISAAGSLYWMKPREKAEAILKKALEKESSERVKNYLHESLTNPHMRAR